MAVIKGISYPFRKGKSGIPATEEDREVIKSSIRQILSTRKGERVMLPGFGSEIYELVFEHNDELLDAKARREVYRSLRTWEPRIDILSVNIEVDENIVTIDIFYEFLAEANDVQVDFSREVS
jgi:phage baseplate assembly protein W